MPYNPTPHLSGFNFSKMQPLYIWDSSIGSSGAFRAGTPSDLASTVNISGQNLTVDIGENIGVTGTVNSFIINSLSVTGGKITATVNATSITGTVNATGFNAIGVEPTTFVGNWPLLGAAQLAVGSGDGGLLCNTRILSSSTDSISVSLSGVNNIGTHETGVASILITNPLNITGFIYPTGDLATLSSQTLILNKLNSLAVTGGSINSTILNPLSITGVISTLPKQFTSQNNFTQSGVAQTVFTLSAGQVGFIRNLDVNPLYVKRGTLGNSISFSDILFGGSATGDGKGGFITLDDWVGAVSVSGSKYLAYVLS